MNESRVRKTLSKKANNNHFRLLALAPIVTRRKKLSYNQSTATKTHDQLMPQKPWPIILAFWVKRLE
jgi:hypothetical protein